MVGALADWFAVTALFRHPLGIPIPHTAIIPNRKDQIGESLGEFVQTNFLTREVLGERLAGAARRAAPRRLAGRAGQRGARRWRRGRRAARHAAGDRRPRRQRRPGAARRRSGCRQMPGRRRSSAGRSTLAMEGGHQERLLDSVLVGLSGFLDDNRPALRERLQHESPWWVPEPVDDRIFNKIFAGVQNFLHDVHDDPNHEVRATINERLAAFAERLRDDPELLKRARS